MRPCPCKGCKDRNAYCHMKGKCPHDFEGWLKEHQALKEKIKEAKKADMPHWTKAQELRHFNYIKFGQGNSKK